MAWRRELVVGAVGGRGVVVIHGRRRVFVRTSGLLGYFQDKIVLLLLFLHFYKQTNKQKQRHLSRSLRRTLVRAAHRVERHLLDWTVAAKLGFLGDGRREGGLTPLLHNNNICICFDSYLIYIHTKKKLLCGGDLQARQGGTQSFFAGTLWRKTF